MNRKESFKVFGFSIDVNGVRRELYELKARLKKENLEPETIRECLDQQIINLISIRDGLLNLPVENLPKRRKRRKLKLKSLFNKSNGD